MFEYVYTDIKDLVGRYREEHDVELGFVGGAREISQRDSSAGGARGTATASSQFSPSVTGAHSPSTISAISPEGKNPLSMPMRSLQSAPNLDDRSSNAELDSHLNGRHLDYVRREVGNSGPFTPRITRSGLAISPLDFSSLTPTTSGPPSVLETPEQVPLVRVISTDKEDLDESE